jgi:ubiquinone/menaquinone biosynthesis C-methylase UbiE
MRIFRKGLGPHALPLAMSGVKLGERMLYVGCGRPALFAAVAARTGLTGRACAVVDGSREVEALQRAAARNGVLVEVAPGASGVFPHAADSFDVAVIDGTDGSFGGMTANDRVHRLHEIMRVTRAGGRLLVIERVARGLRALLGTAHDAPDYRSAGGAKAALEEAGFRPARVLAEREHFRFTEGIKPAGASRT